jgi:hypothetical protein
VGRSRFAARENLTVSFVEVPDDERRVENLVSILSEGVYAYLKKGGRCSMNSGRKGSEKRIIPKLSDAAPIAEEVRQ